MPIIIKNPWRYLVFVGGRDFWTRSQGQEYGLICSTEKHVMRGDVQVFEIDKKIRTLGIISNAISRQMFQETVCYNVA